MSIVTPSTLPPGTWVSDPVHSHVGFSVKHMIVSTFRGRFEDYEAKLSVTDDGTASLSGAVRADSIVVRDADLAEHLKAPEFFDTEAHPELGFASTDIRRDGDRVELDGTLTIKGRTLPVTGRGTIVGPHEDPWGGVRLGLHIETVVDRRQFGLEWNMPLPKGGFALGNDVTLHIDLEFVSA